MGIEQRSAHRMRERSLEDYRKLFPITRDWIYLQHASIGPLSAPVLEAAERLLASQAQSGTEAYASWLQGLEGTRAAAAELIHATPEEVSFVRNTAEGLSRIAFGLPWSPGDNIVTNSIEYPTNVLPWLALRDRGVDVRVVAALDGRVRLEDLVNHVDRRTRLIAVSSVQFSTGQRLDLDGLGTFCRERGILLSVDAIQQLGALPLDVRTTPVDFVSAGAHKWLLAPCGTGIFYCRRELLGTLRPIEVGYAGTQQYSLHREFLEYALDFLTSSRRFEGGLPAFSGLAGLGASLRLFLEIGVDRIAGHVVGLTDRVAEELPRWGFQILSPRSAASEKSAILSFIHARVAAEDIKRSLAERGISVSLRVAKGVSFTRISPHFYNTQMEMEQLLDSLKGIARGVG